jgi:hypothetical protein
MVPRQPDRNSNWPVEAPQAVRVLHASSNAAGAVPPIPPNFCRRRKVWLSSTFHGRKELCELRKTYARKENLQPSAPQSGEKGVAKQHHPTFTSEELCEHRKTHARKKNLQFPLFEFLPQTYISRIDSSLCPNLKLF